MPDTETCERQESRVQYSFSLASNLKPLQAGAVTMTNPREVQTIWYQTLWSKWSNPIPLFYPLNAMHNPVVWNRFLWSKFISATCNNKEKKKKKKGKYVPSSRFLSHSSVHPTYGTRVESTFISICATTRSWRGKDGQNKLWPDSHNPAFTTESSVEWMAAIKFCWVAIYNKDTALEIYAHVRSLSEPQVKRRYTRVGVWWGRKCRTEGNHARRSLWKPKKPQVYRAGTV